MRFAFTEDQALFRDATRDLLARECTPARVRVAWQNESGRSPEVWAKLAEVGVVGATASEGAGGLGLRELGLALLLEEMGRVALPEPIVEHTALALPLLERYGDDELKARYLARAIEGEALLTVGLSCQRYVAHVGAAELVLLERDGALWAVESERLTHLPQRSVDRSRRPSRLVGMPSDATCLLRGAEAKRVLALTFDRAAVATAAQLLGLARAMLAMTVDYAQVRTQFGKSIGSFQAVQHRLVDAATAIEFAAPLVYRGAHGLEVDVGDNRWRSAHASMAFLEAAKAAHLSGRAALQVHGAIGYTFEHDLHLWMKRAWALEHSLGGARLHRERVGEAVFADTDSNQGWKYV